jgi:hypothetical protein
VQVVGGDGCRDEKHGEGGFADGELERFGGKEPSGSPSPQSFTVVEGCSAVGGEPEGSAGTANEPESLRQSADLVQVVEFVLAAGQSVQARVPPSEAPGGVLDEGPVQVPGLGESLAAGQFTEEPAKRRNGILHASRETLLATQLGGQRLEETAAGRAAPA